MEGQSSLKRRRNQDSGSDEAGMAELLWHSRHAEEHRITEWVAVPPNSDVYLEAVETTKDTQTETAWIGTA